MYFIVHNLDPPFKKIIMLKHKPIYLNTKSQTRIAFPEKYIEFSSVLRNMKLICASNEANVVDVPIFTHSVVHIINILWKKTNADEKQIDAYMENIPLVEIHSLIKAVDFLDMPFITRLASDELARRCRNKTTDEIKKILVN